MLKYMTKMINAYLLGIILTLTLKATAEYENTQYLSDSNLYDYIMNSSDPWMVHFYEPECEKCNRLKPVWE